MSGNMLLDLKLNRAVAAGKATLGESLECRLARSASGPATRFGPCASRRMRTTNPGASIIKPTPPKLGRSTAPTARGPKCSLAPVLTTTSQALDDGRGLRSDIDKSAGDGLSGRKSRAGSRQVHESETSSRCLQSQAESIGFRLLSPHRCGGKLPPRTPEYQYLRLLGFPPDLVRMAPPHGR